MDETASRSKEYWSQASSCETRGDLEQAVALLRKAIETDNRNVLAYGNLARLYLTKLDDLKMAEYYCQQGYAVTDIPPEITAAPVWLDDIHEEVTADFDLWMMCIRLEQGRIEEARSLLNRIKAFFDKYSKGNYLTAKQIFEKKTQASEQDAEPVSTTASRNGCFIATAASGNPLTPEVLLLSSLRDSVLLHNRIGRIIVRFYYVISPPIAVAVARSLVLRQIVMSLVVRPTAYLARAWMRRS